MYVYSSLHYIYVISEMAMLLLRQYRIFIANSSVLITYKYSFGIGVRLQEVINDCSYQSNLTDLELQ